MTEYDGDSKKPFNYHPLIQGIFLGALLALSPRIISLLNLPRILMVVERIIVGATAIAGIAFGGYFLCLGVGSISLFRKYYRCRGSEDRALAGFITISLTILGCLVSAGLGFLLWPVK